MIQHSSFRELLLLGLLLLRFRIRLRFFALLSLQLLLCLSSLGQCRVGRAHRHGCDDMTSLSRNLKFKKCKIINMSYLMNVATVTMKSDCVMKNFHAKRCTIYQTLGRVMVNVVNCVFQSAPTGARRLCSYCSAEVKPCGKLLTWYLAACRRRSRTDTNTDTKKDTNTDMQQTETHDIVWKTWCWTKHI